MEILQKLFKEKKAKVGIIGLGYVGLPTAVGLGLSGYKVFGVDMNSKRVLSINRGKSYIPDVSSQQLREVVKGKMLRAFNDYSSLRHCDAILICVPTPLDKNKLPDVSFMKTTAEGISNILRRNQLIVLESSTYPGTTRELILPILSKVGLKVGQDFFLAYSPERIDPGNNQYHLLNTPRVVGGITNKCTEIAVTFYSTFIKADIIPMSSPEAAEMTKILENVFRLINISFINELALLTGKMGIDIWEVIEAAKTKPYGFMPFYPSPKVGGHCIPIDPFYLTHKAKEYNFWTRFIELAGEINEQMPHYVVTKIIWALNLKDKAVKGSKILVWGAAYKKDISDSRESAVYDIASDLLRKGAIVDYFDPYIPKLQLKDRFLKKTVVLKSINYTPACLINYDLVLILTDHSGFDYNEIARKSKLVIDTRNVIKSRKHKNVSHL